MDDDRIAGGFDKFGGVKRRFSRVGDVDGAAVIDDYAHHPVEIRVGAVGGARSRRKVASSRSSSRTASPDSTI